MPTEVKFLLHKKVGGNWVPVEQDDFARVDWDSLEGKPSTFSPSSHTHNSSEIADATSDGDTNKEAVLKTNDEGQLIVTGLVVRGPILCQDYISIYNGPMNSANVGVGGITATRTINFPNDDGTLALTSSADGSITSADVSGLSALATTIPGTGVATFLTTPSSANLHAALTTKTGTGSAVFATSPTITDLIFNGSAQFNATTYVFGGGSLAALKTAMSIGNVNNTSDANKPVSTATQTALNLKVPYTGATTDVNLGAYNLTANAVTTDLIYSSVSDANIDVVNRQLLTGSFPSIDWGSYYLYNYDEIPVIDWGNTTLIDGMALLSLNWNTRQMFTSAANTAIDFSGSVNSGYPLSIDGMNLAFGGQTSYYNNIATAGNGQSVIRAVNDSTGNAAAIATTTIYTTPATSAGLYRLSFVAKVTRAATSSSTLGGANGFRAVYTDNDDNVVVTTGNITNVSGSTLAGNTTQVIYSGSVVVNAKGNTNIRFSFDYTSSGATTMQYALHVKCEQL